MFDIDQTEYKKRDAINESQDINLKNLSKYHLDEVESAASALQCGIVKARNFNKIFEDELQNNSDLS